MIEERIYWFIFDGPGCIVWNWNIHFWYEIRESFIKFPLRVNNKFLPTYVLPLSAQYMKVACWLFKGNDTLETKKENPNMCISPRFSFRQNKQI